MDAVFQGESAAARLGTCGIQGGCSGTHAWSRPTAMNASTLRFYLFCNDVQSSSDCPPRDDAWVLIESAEVTLADDADPEFVNAPSGDLMTLGTPVSGARHVLARARDLGSGVRRIKVEIDGQIMAEADAAAEHPACVEPFVSPVPCPSQFEARPVIDTANLMDGSHAVRILAEDASGRVAASGPLTIETQNGRRPPDAPLICADEGQRRLTVRLSRRSVPYGSVLRIVGRVRGESAPPEARVIAVNADDMRPIGATSVGKSGRYELRLKPHEAGRARMILTIDGASGTCSPPVRFTIRPAVRLRITPRSVRNGRRIMFRGRVLAPQLPSDGKTILLRARARGERHWLDVSTLRTGRDGQFRFSYRFRRTFVRTVYEFVAVAVSQRGFPFRPSRSRLVRVLVRG